MNKQELFSELSIKIAILEAKIDKLLQLAIEPQQEFVINQNVDCSGINEFNLRRIFNPPQWPNESGTDYMKRIGTYNVAQSVDEEFSENFK